jgi:hypothetical protein
MATTDDPKPGLKGFFLAALLWLPAAFFLWFVLRSVVVFAPIRLAGFVLTRWMPELFRSSAQEYERFIYTIAANVAGVAGLPTGTLEISLDVNALQYCYGLPVLVGLVMATPLDWKRTFAQLLGGWALLVPVQAFGLVFEAFRDVYFGLGGAVASGLVDAGYPAAASAAGQAAASAGAATLAAHGLSAELVGVAYQFAYLALPAIAPVVIWVAFNRRFIEVLTLEGRPMMEPAGTRRGPSDS